MSDLAGAVQEEKEMRGMDAPHCTAALYHAPAGYPKLAELDRSGHGQSDVVRLLAESRERFVKRFPETESKRYGRDQRRGGRGHPRAGPPARVFKTLVTTGKRGTHYVVMIPAAEELDLKKTAAHAGEKSLEMLKSTRHK